MPGNTTIEGSYSLMKRAIKQLILPLLIMTLGVLSGCSSITKNQRSTEQLLRYNPDIKQTTLDNGFRALVLANRKPEQRVYLRLVVNAGSLNEDDDQRGVAHFVEHMAFNGTVHYPGNSVIQKLEQAGMKFGLGVNAYTDFENTVYKLNLPDNQPETLALALDIIADWAGRVTIRPDDVDGERGVILEEWRSRLGPMLRLGDAKSQLELAGSRYLQRDPIGTTAIIKGVSYQRVKDFYQRWYRPDNMSLVVAGDIDPEQVTDMLRQRFAYLKKPASPLPEVDYHIPTPSGWRVGTVTAEGVEEPALELGFSQPFDLSISVARSRSDLAQQVMTRLLNLRLQEWTEQQPAIASAALFTTSLGRETSQSLFSLPLHSPDFSHTTQALFAVLAQVNQHGFTEKEVHGELRRLQSVLERNRTKPEFSIDMAGDMVVSAATGQHLLAQRDRVELNSRLLASLTLEDINTAFKTLISPPSRTLMFTVAEGKPEPLIQTEQVEAWWDQAMTTSQPQYQPATVEGSLPEFKGTAGKLWLEKEWPESGIKEFRLSNGSRLVYHFSDSKPGRVYFRAQTDGGRLNVPVEQYQFARIASTLVDESGVGGVRYKAIQQMIGGRILGLTTLFDENYQGVSGWSDRQDFEVLLRLFRLKLSNPGVTQKTLDEYKRDMSSRLIDTTRDPWLKYSAAVESRRFPGQPGVYSLDRKTLDSLTTENLEQAYRQTIQQRTDFTYFVSGDIPPRKLLPLVRRYLADVPVKTEPVSSRVPEPANDQPRLTLSQNQEPRAEVELYLTTPSRWYFGRSVQLELAGELVQDQLRDQLREQASGVYGVSSWFWQAPYEPFATARIGFSCDPERVDELLQLTHKVLDKIAREGISEQALDNKLRQNQDQFERTLKAGAGWMDAAALSYQMTETPVYLRQQEFVYKDTTKQDIDRLVKTFIAQSDRFEAVLMASGKEN
ncbi:M16 family metallopeptidase [Endozoicomonadaceae bacterium StTr2]